MSIMLSCLVVKRERAEGAEQLDSTCLLVGHLGTVQRFEAGLFPAHHVVGCS